LAHPACHTPRPSHSPAALPAVCTRFRKQHCKMGNR
jgi:hypothetical protein